jgi:hypothetical protein
MRMRFTVGQLLGRSPWEWANKKPFPVCWTGSSRTLWASTGCGRHPKVRGQVESSAPAPGTKVPMRQAGAWLGNHSQVPCPGDRLGTVGGPELAQDVADVLFHRVEGDHQLVRDALVRLPRGDSRSTAVSRSVSGSTSPGQVVKDR